MKKLLLAFLMLSLAFPIFAEKNICASKIIGYDIVRHSIFPFFIDKKKACFFAFYTNNPDPMTDTQGNGNMGKSIWFAYYLMTNPFKIYKFQKPSSSDWSMVCHVDAVSFYDMNGDKKRDVTVIGSCDKNSINYTVAFYFVRHNNRYVLDKKLYRVLYGYIGLTISDVRKYINSPTSYIKILEKNNIIEPDFME